MAALLIVAIGAIAAPASLVTAATPKCNGKTATKFLTSPGTLNGDPGVADVLVGSSGNDTINGDADNDTIFGGDGIDTIKGGMATTRSLVSPRSATTPMPVKGATTPSSTSVGKTLPKAAAARMSSS